jgi:glutathione S-transferase
MKLLSSNASPFVRKVRIAIREKGLTDQIADTPINVLELPPEITTVNPLAKVPTLMFEDGHSLFDSSVIFEFLDTIGHGPRLVPDATGPDATGSNGRWAAKRWEAIADGLCDAAVLIRLEKALRPAHEQSPSEIARQFSKIDRALELLEQESAAFSNCWHVGTISIACALSYLDLRFADLQWRRRFPKLSAFEDACDDHQSYLQTALIG